LPAIDRNSAALQWWLSLAGRCICGLDSPTVVGDHLRLPAGEDCLERIVSSFDEWWRDGGRPVLVEMDTVWRRG